MDCINFFEEKQFPFLLSSNDGELLVNTSPLGFTFRNVNYNNIILNSIIKQPNLKSLKVPRITAMSVIAIKQLAGMWDLEDLKMCRVNLAELTELFQGNYKSIRYYNEGAWELFLGLMHVAEQVILTNLDLEDVLLMSLSQIQMFGMRIQIMADNLYSTMEVIPIRNNVCILFYMDSFPPGSYFRHGFKYIFAYNVNTGVLCLDTKCSVIPSKFKVCNDCNIRFIFSEKLKKANVVNLIKNMALV